jgi:hypothetical protein
VAKRRKTGSAPPARTSRTSATRAFVHRVRLAGVRGAPPAQHHRRADPHDAGRRPGDGLGRINGDLFGRRESRVVAMSYDYTVLAGTQGKKNHAKKDRMFQLAEKLEACRWCSSPRAAAAARATPTRSSPPT